MDTIKKLNDNELEITEEAEKYIYTKEVLQKKLAHAKTVVKEYEDLLAYFD